MSGLESLATRCWQQAGVFEQIAHEQTTAAVLDGRVLRSTKESGRRAGDDGYKQTNSSKVPIAVDTLGPLRLVGAAGRRGC